jgi:hypothetical protein
MMLIISVLRYRATVHPLKPDVSRRKLKVVCGLVYIVGFIAGYATNLPVCFIMQRNDVTIVFYGYVLSCFYFFPTAFMAVSLGPVYEFVCVSFTTGNLNCFRVK